jgi:hypothetical protein
MKQIVKESVNIYNELRPHYSLYADSKQNALSQIKDENI